MTFGRAGGRTDSRQSVGRSVGHTDGRTLRRNDRQKTCVSISRSDIRTVDQLIDRSDGWTCVRACVRDGPTYELMDGRSVGETCVTDGRTVQYYALVTMHKRTGPIWVGPGMFLLIPGSFDVSLFGKLIATRCSASSTSITDRSCSEELTTPLCLRNPLLQKLSQQQVLAAWVQVVFSRVLSLIDEARGHPRRKSAAPTALIDCSWWCKWSPTATNLWLVMCQRCNFFLIQFEDGGRNLCWPFVLSPFFS